jgi:uncharacterized membrane protein
MWALSGGIIWVIGAAMVLLAGLVFLPTSAVAAFGVAVIAFHNLLDGKSAADMHLPEWVWGILHDPRGGEVVAGVSFAAGYGLLPCLGIMAAGYGLGATYLLEPDVRRRQLLGLGLMLTTLFVVLRFSNLYGDPPSPQPSLPGPWSQREPWYFTVYSFLNCQKYPMSLLFTLMTLGPSITLLGLFEWARGPVARFFIVFGRVPLFFYLLHVPLIHGLAVGLDYLRFAGVVAVVEQRPVVDDQGVVVAGLGEGLADMLDEGLDKLGQAGAWVAVEAPGGLRGGEGVAGLRQSAEASGHRLERTQVLLDQLAVSALEPGLDTG